jgi:hypothetical protein
VTVSSTEEEVGANLIGTTISTYRLNISGDEKLSVHRHSLEGDVLHYSLLFTSAGGA